MRDKDLRRVAALLLRHRTSPQASPTRGLKEEWALVKFADWALPLLIEAEAIGADGLQIPSAQSRDDDCGKPAEGVGWE